MSPKFTKEQLTIIAAALYDHEKALRELSLEPLQNDTRIILNNHLRWIKEIKEKLAPYVDEGMIRDLEE